MQPDRQPPATTFAAVNSDARSDRPSTPPVVMSHNVSGPVDPMEFYLDLNSPPTPDDDARDPLADYDEHLAPPPSILPAAAAVRSVSQSPVRSHQRNDPGASDRALSTMRSDPALLQSRQPGKVKNIANRFDRPVATGWQQSAPAVGNEQGRQPGNRNTQQMPSTSSSSSGGRNALTKTPRQQTGNPKSPQRTPNTSFEAPSSFSSTATSRTAKSQPAKTDHTHSRSRPLFGEVTDDGRWNGSLDMGAGYTQRPTLSHGSRRASEGSLALNHTRPRASQGPVLDSLQPHPRPPLKHRRSRSDMESGRGTGIPTFNHQSNLTALAASPDLAMRFSTPRNSRIPVSSVRHASVDSSPASAPHSRSPSALSNPTGKRRVSKSPTRARGKENEVSPMSNSTPRNRYNPPSLASPTSNQTLSAKIVAPLPKMSPPLRSSRPRLPISSAANPGGRPPGNEAPRLQGAGFRDGRNPGEQWLGKPFEPSKERARRKIPELDKIDFEERKARIQRAISQHLESNRSMENLRSKSASRSRSRARKHMEDPHTVAGADSTAEKSDHEVQAEALDLDTDDLNDRARADPSVPVPDLTVETATAPDSSRSQSRPLTPPADVEAESPVLGRNSLEHATPRPAQKESSLYLSATTYQPPTRKPLAAKLPEMESVKQAPNFGNPSLLTTNLSPFRERDSFLISATDESPSVADSASDFGRRWGGNSPAGDEGSIRIMLDEDSHFVPDAARWSESVGQDIDQAQSYVAMHGKPAGASEQHRPALAMNGHAKSEGDIVTNVRTSPAKQTLPRQNGLRDSTARASESLDSHSLYNVNDEFAHEGVVGRVLDHYQSTGTLTAEMLRDMQDHMVDLHRLSANGGSNAIVVQNLLDSIVQGRQEEEHNHQQEQMLGADTYRLPAVTPDTPTEEEFIPGTVLVYGKGARTQDDEDEESFESKIRKADAEWERQKRGEDSFPTSDPIARPQPPPKDSYFSPRTSNPTIHTLQSSDPAAGGGGGGGLQVPTDSEGNSAETTDAEPQLPGQSIPRPVVHSAASAPPQPGHAPPPPPPEPTGTTHLHGLQDVSGLAQSGRPSSELSLGVQKSAFGASGSSRQSVDSQQQPNQLPSAGSTSSLGDSAQQESDNQRDSQTKLAQSASTGPEHKRLSKRRYIIKELLDTENTYYQDLKIIEDIYKATCTPDLVTPDDKKVLFGNCDEVERFALQFYDDMRKATAQVYVPPKQHRWTNNKRGSFSTTQSDATGQTSMTDSVDDERDRTTSIGRAFLIHLPRMEQVYGSYLKNHDAANRRLAALVGSATVKCWLDECHANASDITAAWDLDSLLVKPTQRVAKYPMLLQQLLETTPADHPDHESLKSAARDSVSMLTRINDAKKRADLVDQIVNRKRKDSDVRSGLAKAFGRRTEKLKERVGIAEAFQDADFDELAHKFGGHFIRLQICMRDVQDYMNRTEKAVELISNYTAALELYTDVWPSSLPEIESKWRRYGQVIRDLTAVAFVEHKAAVQKRVLAPMIQCIKLHEGPQNAINKRKKRIIDYAKCKSDERRGQKPDKKTIEASDMYVALNDQLKIELPKLYSLTATLVQNCLNCFLDIQLQWQDAWQRKLRPLLDAADVPESIKQIEPAFLPDYAEVEKRLLELAICNGTLKQDTASLMAPSSASLLSPSSTAVDSMERGSRRRPSTLDSYDRTFSVGSDGSGHHSRRHSGINAAVYEAKSPHLDGRIRSNSSISPRAPVPAPAPGAGPMAGAAGPAAHRPWSNSTTPTSTFSSSRPTTANPPTGHSTPRISSDQQRSPRPASGATYFTARPEQTDSVRFSGIFNSALPPSESTVSLSSSSTAVASSVATAGAAAAGADHAGSSPPTAPPDTPVLFVCASLFEFSIDRTRREGGYPYLTYVQGEVFDVIAQKGELWLAKNQDDAGNTLGWIWEQHFIVLSQE